MKLNTKWLTPLQRSYQQIRNGLIDALSKIKDKDGNPLITDFSEGNILVLILSAVAGVAEMIHYYIDTMARETFFSTARKYSSLEKHAALVDYHPRVATAAQCNVILTRSLTENSTAIQINKESIWDNLQDTNGNVWKLVKDITIQPGTSQVIVPYIQKELSIGALRSTVYRDLSGTFRAKLNEPTEGYFLHKGTDNVTINGESYTLVDTFAYSKPSDAHFILTSTESGTYIIFGDGTFGKHPEEGDTVLGDCYLTKGEAGNISPGGISGSQEGFSYSNLQAGGGSNYESFNMLKQRVPLSVKTLGVAITKQDYVDLALQNPSVAQAALEYVCGRKLNIYISPVGGGTPSDGLLQQVKTDLELHAPLNTWLNILPVDQANIILNMDVTGNPSYKQQDIYNNIISALSQAYPVDGPIGGKVRLSDIYALIDNLPSVDFLHINQFYVMPATKILYGNVPLVVNSFTLNKANGIAKYLVEIKGEQVTIRPYKNITTFSSASGTSDTTSSEVFEGKLNNSIYVNYPEGFEFTIGFKAGENKDGFKYEFQVSNLNSDYDKSGFNIPVFNAENLTLDITEVV